jgi:hypothetical protein
MRTAVLTALFLPALACATQRVDVTTTEKTDFAAGGTVRIEGSTGELNIEGWDQPFVEIEVVRSVWTEKKADDVKAELGRIAVTKKLEGKELTFTTSEPKKHTRAQINYRIHVPANTKLVIHHRIGDVVIYGVDGDIDATAKVGDVAVQLREPAKYQIDAFTKLGGIYSDFDGKIVHRRSGMGESLNPAAEGTGDARRVSLHVGTGGISIQKVTV